MAAVQIQSDPALRGLHDDVRYRAEYAMAWFQVLTGGRIQPNGTIRGGIRPTVTSGFRTAQKQRELYAARASNPYPVNRPGDSPHEYGMAFDSDVADQYMPLWIQVRRACGFRVPDNDEVHGEVPNWRAYVGRAA